MFRSGRITVDGEATAALDTSIGEFSAMFDWRLLGGVDVIRQPLDL